MSRDGFRQFCLAPFVALFAPLCVAQSTVRVRIRINGDDAKISDTRTAVWLEQLSDDIHDRPCRQFKTCHVQLLQKNKAFEPHLLVVPVGTTVEFPNRDPYFHNAFSWFNGTRFDLGLYESGVSRSVRFDSPGVSYVFCNIHKDMAAAIVVVPTPYFGVSDRNGNVSIRNVKPGQYRLRVWAEGASVDALNELSHSLVVKGDVSIDALELSVTKPHTDHKNKYGLDYDPALGAAHTYR